MLDVNLMRVGAVSAIIGPVLLLAATLLHPLQAHPGDAIVAFQDYARDHYWVATHLLQFLGVAMITGGLVALYGALLEGAGGTWVRLGLVSAVANLAMAAALQAIDGVALKIMVDAWVSTTELEKPLAFYATFTVRQIEIGFASMVSLLSGLTVFLYGIAVALDTVYPKWLGWIAMVTGLATAAGGVAVAHAGFSDIALMINTPANALLLLWVVVMGILMWRQAEAAT